MTFQGSIHHKKMTHCRCGSVNQKCALSFEINQRTQVKTNKLNRAKPNKTRNSVMAIATFSSIISIFNDFFIPLLHFFSLNMRKTGDQMYQSIIY